MNIKNPLVIKATVVANEFIDEYMPSANGEYVKVYLYILRHGEEKIEIRDIADALDHTESDVRRALAYWKRFGILEEAKTEKIKSETMETRAAKPEAIKSEVGTVKLETAAADLEGIRPGAAAGIEGLEPKDVAADSEIVRSKKAAGGSQETGTLLTRAGMKGRENQKPKEEIPPPLQQPKGEGMLVETCTLNEGSVRKVYTVDEINRLAGDEEFTQLLYIAQKYMNRLFTQRDSEIIAYLYDGLKMPAELIEYLVEYCVQNQHTSLRYMEKTAIAWKESGIRTVEQAKARTEGFSKDYFAVMKAFGLGGRRPGDAEITYLEKWFRSYGFTRRIIVEACNRTIESIHQPSFQYADKILSEWKKAGVKRMEDIEAFGGRGKKTGNSQNKKPSSGNRFHNFEQRNTDYDALVMELWQKEK